LPERRGLGLGVQHRVDNLAIKHIANGDYVGLAVLAGGGQVPGASRAKKAVLGSGKFGH